MRKGSLERPGHTRVEHRTAKPRLRRRLRFEGALVRTRSLIPSDQEISLHQQKSPTRHLGACGITLSREERGLLRRGRVAWLTAFQPITVAGAPPPYPSSPPLPAPLHQYTGQPAI